MRSLHDTVQVKQEVQDIPANEANARDDRFGKENGRCTNSAGFTRGSDAAGSRGLHRLTGGLG